MADRAESIDSPARELTGVFGDIGSLRRIVFSRPLKGKSESIQKVTVQPVRLRGTLMLQFSYTHDSKKVIVKNHDPEAARGELEAVLRTGFRFVTLLLSDATIQFETLADGTTRRTRGAPEPTNARVDLGHDRKKNTLLGPENAREVLTVLGFLTGGGDVKPTMQKKFRQVNEFVRVLDNTPMTQETGPEALTVVDCGCGNAYLTFAAFHYLAAVRQRKVLLTGVDRDGEAVRRNNGKAEALGLAGVRFVQSAITAYVPPVPPDIVLSLHACDTATDDAIMNAVTWKSRLVLCAPCCHHHLNRQLKANHDTIMTRGMARHGILVEKMGDSLTDLFRVLILSIMGYQVNTLKFVDPDNTERNTLIKAELPVSPGEAPPSAASAAQYRELKSFWNVTPYLEDSLGAVFRERLELLPRTTPAS